MLGIFDKLILLILTYGSEVSGLSKADNIERTHLQFCKHFLGVKIQTQNNFVYGKYAKYTKLTYNMMLNDLQNFPVKSSWAKSVK